MSEELNLPLTVPAVLVDILKSKKAEIEEAKALRPERLLLQSEFMNRDCISLSKSLKDNPPGLIAEFKRKSPSRGWIHENADLKEVVKGYERAGAAAISVLTDAPFFGGDLSFVPIVRRAVNLPILRKEFIIDPYQILEAKANGADAILLIASALSAYQCQNLADYAKELGLEVLLEIHSIEELGHFCDAVDVIGVNNRNLHEMTTSISTSVNLLAELPDGLVKISESGIEDAKAMKDLATLGYEGFLIGTAFMEEKAPELACQNLMNQFKAF